MNSTCRPTSRASAPNRMWRSISTDWSPTTSAASRSQAPIVQHRETIALPELAGPGAWFVDFISGQVSARALIRKGRLNTFPDRTADGPDARVFDESGKPVAKASLSWAGKPSAADAKALITIPNAPNQPITQGVVVPANSPVRHSVPQRRARAGRPLPPRPRAIARRSGKPRSCSASDSPTTATNSRSTASKSRARAQGGLLGGVTTERVIAENLTPQARDGSPLPSPRRPAEAHPHPARQRHSGHRRRSLKLSGEILSTQRRPEGIPHRHRVLLARCRRPPPRSARPQWRAARLTRHHPHSAIASITIRHQGAGPHRCAHGRVDLGKLDTIDY
jgi:hypothetical protein